MIPALLLLFTLAAAPAEVPPEPTPGLQRDVPEMHELPWSQRKTLPDIKLTIWHFDTDPALRWAKVNGLRLAEGEETEAGLKLRQVRTDGVIMEFGGHAFRLGLP